ncbi:MAG TPA: hypothetical protein VIL69_08370, partial [Roseomonas sp.]
MEYGWWAPQLSFCVQRVFVERALAGLTCKVVEREKNTRHGQGVECFRNKVLRLRIQPSCLTLACQAGRQIL